MPVKVCEIRRKKCCAHTSHAQNTTWQVHVVHSSYHHWSSFHRSSKSLQKVSSTTIDMEVNNIFLFNVRVKTKRRALVVAIVPCFLRNVFHSFELVSVIWSQSLNFFDVQPFKFFEAGDHVDLVPFLFWNRVWKNRLLHILFLLTFPRCGFLLLLLLLLRLSFLWLWLCLFSLCTVFGLDLFFSIRCLGLLVVISCIVIWVCFVRGWLLPLCFLNAMASWWRDTCASRLAARSADLLASQQSHLSSSHSAQTSPHFHFAHSSVISSFHSGPESAVSLHFFCFLFDVFRCFSLGLPPMSVRSSSSSFPQPLPLPLPLPALYPFLGMMAASPIAQVAWRSPPGPSGNSENRTRQE